MQWLIANSNPISTASCTASCTIRGAANCSAASPSITTAGGFAPLLRLKCAKAPLYRQLYRQLYCQLYCQLHRQLYRLQRYR